MAITGIRPNQLDLIDCSSGVVRQSVQLGGVPGGFTFDYTGQHLIAVLHDRILIWNLAESDFAMCDIPNVADYDLYCSTPSFCVDNDSVWVLVANQWQHWSVRYKRMVSMMSCPRGERLLAHACVRSGYSVAVTYDEQCLNHSSPTLSVWELDYNRCLCAIRLDSWQDAVVTPDTALALTAAPQSENSISVWNLQTGEKRYGARGLFDFARHAFCGRNRHIVTGVPATAGILWTSIAITDLCSGVQRIIDPEIPTPPSLVASPVANVFATVANDNRHPVDMTAFWSSVSGEQLGWTVGHPGHSTQATFSPCGRWFATTVQRHDVEAMNSAVSVGSIIITDLSPLVPNQQAGLVSNSS